MISVRIILHLSIFKRLMNIGRKLTIDSHVPLNIVGTQRNNFAFDSCGDTFGSSALDRALEATLIAVVSDKLINLTHVMISPVRIQALLSITTITSGIIVMRLRTNDTCGVQDFESHDRVDGNQRIMTEAVDFSQDIRKLIKNLATV